MSSSQFPDEEMSFSQLKADLSDIGSETCASQIRAICKVLIDMNDHYHRILANLSMKVDHLSTKVDDLTMGFEKIKSESI